VNFIGQQISAHEIALSVADAARPNAWLVAHAGLAPVGSCSRHLLSIELHRTKTFSETEYAEDFFTKLVNKGT
jgi:hypothetical protein